MPSGVGNHLWYVFVEDPGAVNYFAPLLEAMRTQGKEFKLFADGFAFSHFSKSGFDPIRPRDLRVLFLMNSPTLVIVGTSENESSAGLQFISMARQHGVKTVGIVDSGINAPHRFRGQANDPIAFAPEHILVPDEWSFQEFIALGISSKSLRIIGQPFEKQTTISEDSNKVRKCVLPVEAQNSFVIAFVSEISEGLDASQYQYGPDYTLYGSGQSTKRTQIVVEEFLDAIKTLVSKGRPKPYLILRRHPKESKHDLKTLVKEFDYESVAENARDIVLSADLVVGISTMLLNEAYWLGVPCLSIVPRQQERNWLLVTRTGAVDCVWNRQSVVERLQKYVDQGRKKSSSTIRNFNPPARIFSSKDVVSFLSGINP